MFIWRAWSKFSAIDPFIQFNQLDKLMLLLRHKNKDNKCKAVYGKDKR